MDVLYKYNKVKNKLYRKYVNGEINLQQREVMLENVREKLFNNIITENENLKERQEQTISIIKEKIKKIDTKINNAKLLINKKCDIIEETIKSIDEEKAKNIYVVIINKKDYTYIFENILPFIQTYIEKEFKKYSENNKEEILDSYDDKLNDLTDELNKNFSTVSETIYSISELKSNYRVILKFLYDLSNNIDDFKNEFNISYLTSLINDIDDGSGYSFLINLYTDLFHWLNMYIEYLNWFSTEIIKSLKIASVNQDILFKDNDKYSDLMKKVYEPIFNDIKEYNKT